MRAITIVAVTKALAGRYGVEVRIQGHTAKTDGRAITIPDLGNNPDERQRALLRGYIDHEAGGHGRHTDFAVLTHAEIPPETRGLLNIIEDIRVERLLGREFSGCLKNLTELNARLLDMSPRPLSALLANGFKLVAGQPLDRAPDPRWATDRFGADVFARIAACASTQDSLALARDLVARLEADSLDALDAGDAEGERLESGGKAAENGEGGGEPKGQKRSDAPDGRRRPGPRDREKNRDAELLENLRSYRDKGAVLADALENAHEANLLAGRYTVYSREGDRFETALEAEDDQVYQELRRALGDLNTLRRQVAQVFCSEKAARWTGDRTQGKIDHRALPRIATGHLRVFKERAPSRHVNTAVSFLVDCSASMRHERISPAMSAVALFLETLDHAGIAGEVLGYTTCGWYDLRGDGDAYGRVDKLLTLVFKSFSERLSAAVRRRIAAYEKIGMAQNCDADSLEIAYERILNRPERRKIIFVLTDGAVCSNGNDLAGRRELQRLVTAIERRGLVELVAIDLLSGEADRYYSKVIAVKESTDLAAQLMAGLKRHLFAGLPRRRRGLGFGW